MGLLRHIIGLLAALLVTAMSTAAMPMAPSSSYQADFFTHQRVFVTEHTNVQFAARAPPTTVANLAVTGAAVAEQGNGVIVHGHDTVVVSLGFTRSSIAPNSADLVPDVPAGVPYFRVQGGGSGNATSRDALTVNPDGSVSITPGCTGAICVSAGSSDHAAYYISERRPDGNVVVFEVDRTTHNQIMETAVDQRNNAGAPVQIVDRTTSGNAVSLQLDQVHSQLMTNGASNGRVLTQQEFLDEFGGN